MFRLAVATRHRRPGLGIGIIIGSIAPDSNMRHLRLLSDRQCDSDADLLRVAGNSEQNGNLANDEFCCLFWGYESKCLTCPLPEAVLHLFEDGTLDPRQFRKFGGRREWSKYEQKESTSEEHSGHVVTVATTLKTALATLGFGDSDSQYPRKRTDLKCAFRERAKLLHPDVGGDTEAFRDLVRAYETALALFRPGSR